MTDRELEILKFTASGLSAKEAAKACGITPRTVEAHLGTIKLKLKARNRTHMVAIASRRAYFPEKAFREF